MGSARSLAGTSDQTVTKRPRELLGDALHRERRRRSQAIDRQHDIGNVNISALRPGVILSARSLRSRPKLNLFLIINL